MRKTCPRCHVILSSLRMSYRDHMMLHVEGDLSESAYHAASDMRELGVNEVTYGVPWKWVRLNRA